MRTALAIALGLVSAAALAQVSQPGSPPGTTAGGAASTVSVITPVSVDAGPTGGASQEPSDAGPSARAARTGDEPATEPAARVYSFDPLPIGSYSFEAPSSSSSTTSQSSPSSNPR